MAESDTRGDVMKMQLKDQSGIDIVYHIMGEGAMIGRIVKGRGSKYPWRAYAGSSHELLGSFYSEEGGKQAAIDAVLKSCR